jgi:3-oxoacyl-[acyl-carrier protein] reductase
MTNTQIGAGIIGVISSENPMSKLRGKVAVVTGASKGIGAAVAKALAAEGAAVVVNYTSSQAGAMAVVDAITAAGGRAIAVKGDVSKAADAGAMIDAAIITFGRLDILVNNAGVYEWVALGDITEAQYRWMFDTNVQGPLLVTRAAVKHLGEGASVINISSSSTTRYPPGTVVYTGTKGAVEAITGVLAVELGARRIRVNTISPGWVETEGTADFLNADHRAAMLAETPLGRSGQPDDIGAVAVFLASNDSRWLTGERLSASGGMR